jgi:hypothetical protein
MEIRSVIWFLLEVIVGYGRLTGDLNLLEGELALVDHCISIETDVCQSQ